MYYFYPGLMGYDAAVVNCQRVPGFYPMQIITQKQYDVAKQIQSTLGEKKIY